MLKSLLAELKRRHVVRVASVYAVVAWAILRGAENFFPALTLPAWTVTFVAVLLLIGFPITLLITWAFEITPDGLRRTTPLDSVEPLSGRDRWIEIVLILGVLLLAGLSILQMSRREGAGSAQGTVPLEAGTAAENSLAVLPFTSFSDDADSNYFADGLTEELIHDVAQIDGLKVSGRTSAFFFKNRNEDLRDVGRQLGVAHVLEGSVRRAGGRLRITVQLISTADGFHLWSQTYDRRMDDIFTIQEDVARNVAAVLAMKLAPARKGAGAAAPPDAESYRQVLVATALLRTRELQPLTQARALFQSVLQRRPDDVDALAGFAEATMYLAAAYATLDFEPATAAALAATEHALQIDPGSVTANIAAGTVYTIVLHRTDDRRYRALAERALSRAVALAPNDPDALTAYGQLLNELGRSAEALDALEPAVERDPLSRAAQFQTIVALEALGQFDAARARLMGLLEREPHLTPAQLELGEMLVGQGQWAAAWPWLQQAHAARTSPRASFALANLYLNLGMEDAVGETLAETQRYAPLTEPICRVILSNMQHDEAAALRVAQAQLAADSDPIWHQLILSAALAVGDLATARAELLTLDAHLLQANGETTGQPDDTLLYAANLLLREGNRERANALLEQLLERSRAPAEGYDPPTNKLLRAKALAELGRDDEALSELRAAQLQGYRMLWDFDYFQRLDRLPWFAGLRGDPRFEAVVSAIERDNLAAARDVQQLRNAAP